VRLRLDRSRHPLFEHAATLTAARSAARGGEAAGLLRAACTAHTAMRSSDVASLRPDASVGSDTGGGGGRRTGRGTSCSPSSTRTSSMGHPRRLRSTRRRRPAGRATAAGRRRPGAGNQVRALGRRPPPGRHGTTLTQPQPAVALSRRETHPHRPPAAAVAVYALRCCRRGAHSVAFNGGPPAVVGVRRLDGRLSRLADRVDACRR
jgi:hypothetical protein